MQSTSYEFTARGKQGFDRPYLMSTWTLIGFALMVMITLVLIFPKQELLQQASKQRLGDSLTINYLTNLLKADPDNLELRLLLAEHKLQLNQPTGVAALINPAVKSADSEWRAKGLLTQYKLLTNQYMNCEPDSAQQEELLVQRIKAFRKLFERSWSVPTLVYLAGQADQLQEYERSKYLYQLISDSASAMTAKWFAAAAARMLANGDYELAAHLFFIARHREYQLPMQREYFLAGIHALLTGNLFERAMHSADLHLDNLQDDSATLYELVRAARSSNDQPRAVRYAKRLLHISWLPPKSSWFPMLGFELIGIANAQAETEMQSTDLNGIKPYDEKDYELAYQVFIENQNLPEAFRVAKAAVIQVPAETEWHKRLAQVAEWTGNSEIALREWMWLLRHHDSREAILGVLRLAPAVNDYGALLDAWKRVSVQQKMDDKQWEKLGEIFEQAGRKREGIKYLEKRYEADRLPIQLEVAALLSEHIGEDAHAIALYISLLKQHGDHPEWVLKIASLYLRKGEFEKAFDLLQTHSSGARESDIAYWKLLGDLAWQLQQDRSAKLSYLRLEAAGKLAREDISRLIYLLDDTRLAEKAALAELAYKQFGDYEMLLLALEGYAASKDMQAQKRLFERAAKDRSIKLSESSRFYMLRAQYFQASGDFHSAHADFRFAAALAPGNVSNRIAILWFLIDAHDLPALREMAAQIVARGDHEKPEFWGALAATYQVLGQTSLAVAYYTRQLKLGGQDFLWLVNYAEALEQARQTDMAARVREYAWSKLRLKLSGTQVNLPYSQDMLAAARLSMLNDPGDPSLALVRSVLRQDRLLVKNIVPDQMTSDLILGWAISTEQSANAKVWLWQRYAKILDKPQWAEAAIAVAENDNEKLENLLAIHADGMSMPVRRDVANVLGQKKLAQSIDYEGLRDDPANDDIHQRLSEDMLAAASFVNIELRDERLDTLRSTVQRFHIEVPVTINTRMAAEFWQTSQTNNVMSSFAGVPHSETIAGIVLKNHNKLGDTEIAVCRRNEFAKTSESKVTHGMSISSRIHLQLGLEVNSDATVSNNMRVFGMQDQINTTLLYNFSKREYVLIQPMWARYYTQTGEFLGSGSHFSWEAGHQLRAEAPDFKVRLTGMHTGFRIASNTAFPLPGNVNIIGVCMGFGEAYRNIYTKSWRLFADYCATNNDLSGQGYNGELGLVGSIIGHDQLSLALRRESGGANITSGLSSEFKLNYRYYY